MEREQSIVLFVDITVMCGYVVQMTFLVPVLERDYQLLVVSNCTLLLEAL